MRISTEPIIAKRFCILFYLVVKGNVGIYNYLEISIPCPPPLPCPLIFRESRKEFIREFPSSQEKYLAEEPGKIRNNPTGMCGTG